MVCYCVTYIIAHIDVMVLRWRNPKLARTFRSPWFPIPQLLSMGAMGYMMWTVHPDPAIRSAVWLRAGIFLAAMAVYSFVWLKFVAKKPLFQPVPVSEMVGEIEIEIGPTEVAIPATLNVQET
jgi:amino acid transporter